MKLTKRQREILVRIPFHSNREIAEQLGISQHGVKENLRRIYRQLRVPDIGADKRLYAVVKALQAGELRMSDFLLIQKQGCENDNTGVAGCEPFESEEAQ